MSDPHDLRLDCQTCLAANTTACNDCIVTHLLANDDGPIQFVSTGLGVVSATVESAPAAPSNDADPDLGHALGLLAKAGLIDDEPTWVDRSEFDACVLTPSA